MTKLIAQILLMPMTLAFMLFSVSVQVFITKMDKLEEIHHRAIMMATKEGYLSTTIQDEVKSKMTALGYPSVVKNGVTYPVFTGSTTTKVLRDAADPTVRVVITYPAPNIQGFLLLFQQPNSEDPGYFEIDSYGRSEAYE